MKKLQILLLSILNFMMISCGTKYLEIDSKNMNQAFILNSSPTFKGYFYQGSDNDFHYFITKWKFTKNTPFKILKTELEIYNTYELHSKEIRVGLIETTTIFGQNDFYKLYSIP